MDVKNKVTTTIMLTGPEVETLIAIAYAIRWDNSRFGNLAEELGNKLVGDESVSVKPTIVDSEIVFVPDNDRLCH